MKKKLIGEQNDDVVAVQSSQRVDHHHYHHHPATCYLQESDKDIDKIATLHKTTSATAAQKVVYREVLRPIDVNVCIGNV